MCAGSLQLASLSVALWHRLSACDVSGSILQQLVHVPAQVSMQCVCVRVRASYGCCHVDLQVVVLVSACCLHWLTLHLQPHPLYSTVEDILKVSVSSTCTFNECSSTL